MDFLILFGKNLKTKNLFLVFDENDLNTIVSQIQNTGQIAEGGVNTLVDYTFLVENIFNSGPGTQINSTTLGLKISKIWQNIFTKNHFGSYF